MAIHFLQSKAAKTLSLAQVFRMSETEAEAAFRKIRWSETNGDAVCPDCGVLEPYEYRRPTGLLRFRCKACGKNFSITSGTLFASHKAPLRSYLAAIAVFMNEVKGKNALALSRDLGMSHKACWVMLHKLREAMAEEFRGRKIGGEGKTAEVDGAYFGGYVKPANLREYRRDRRFAMNPVRQAPERRYRSRAQRQQPSRRVRFGRCGPVMDQKPREPWHRCKRRRRKRLERSGQQIRNEAHQSQRGV